MTIRLNAFDNFSLKSWSTNQWRVIKTMQHFGNKMVAVLTADSVFAVSLDFVLTSVKGFSGEVLAKCFAGGIVDKCTFSRREVLQKNSSGGIEAVTYLLGRSEISGARRSRDEPSVPKQLRPVPARSQT